MLQLADISRGVSPFPSRLGNLSISSHFCLSRGWEYCIKRKEGAGRDREVASLVMFPVCIYTASNSQLGSTFSVFGSRSVQLNQISRTPPTAVRAEPNFKSVTWVVCECVSPAIDPLGTPLKVTITTHPVPGRPWVSQQLNSSSWFS